MAITNQLAKQVDLPVWEWLRFNPVGNTSSLTALTTNRDGTDRYMYYFGSSTLYRYDTWGDTWYTMSVVSTPVTALTAQYVKNQGYQGPALISGSIANNQIRIGGVGTRNMVGLKIQIISGTGAGQERTITAVTDDIIHDFGLCTSASTSVLTDNTKKWKQNQWVGYGCRINFNGGQFQSRQVIYNSETAATVFDSNYEGRIFNMATYNSSSPYGAVSATAGSQTGFVITSQIVTVDTNWTVNPDATSRFKILSGGIWWLSSATASPFFNFLYYDVLTDTTVSKLAPTGIFTAALGTDFTITPLSEKLLGNLVTATVTSASSRNVTVSGATWTVGSFVECDVIITSGTGIGQRRRIISNTATTLTISIPWSITPDATSVISITSNDDVYWAGNNQSRMMKYSPRANMWTFGNITDFGICSNTPIIRSNGRLPHSITTATRNTNGVTSINTTPPNGGTNYSVGDILTLTTGGSGCKVYVEAVNNVGAVTSVSLYTCGAGYTASTTSSTTSTSGGSGCTVTIVSVGIIGVITTNLSNDIQLGESISIAGITETAWNNTYTVLGIQSQTIFEIITTATATANALYFQGTNLLVDYTKNWIPNEFAGKILILQSNGINGTATFRKIIGNSNTTISFIGGVAPTNGNSRYCIQDIESFGKDFQYYADQQISQGFATSGSASTINDTTKAWLANVYSGQKVEVINPDGTRMEDIIRFNSATSLSLGRILAGGSGTNTLAYSDNGGAIWTGLGNTIFSTQCNGICWSGTRFVAVGSGTNSIAWSNDGITWTGLGLTIFSTSGNGICWSGNKFVAVGNGTNTIAYSYDGITWTASSNLFSTGGFAAGYAVAWNGTRFVAVGSAANVTTGWSNDGITWTAGTNIFTSAGTPSGFGVCWAPTLNGGSGFFVAVGNGPTYATSSDGITWTGSGNTALTTQGNSVVWNGSILVAVGIGTSNTIATSTDGTTWTGRGNAIFTTAGQAVTWDGTNFIAVGSGTNTVAQSSNGISWIGMGTPFTTSGVRTVSCTTPFASVFPAIGIVPTTGTQYRIHDSYGTVSSGTVTSLTDATKRWKLNQWAGKRVLITSGSGLAQEITSITSNTISTLNFSTITTAPDSTSTYTILGKLPAGAGIEMFWNAKTTEVSKKGRTLILPRGGTSTFDKFDLTTNTWTYGLFIQGQGEILTTGNMYAYDEDRIYFHQGTTGRIMYFDIVNNTIEGFGYIPYGMSTAILSNRMEIIQTVDGLKYLYIMRHTGTEFWRTIIIF